MHDCSAHEPSLGWWGWSLQIKFDGAVRSLASELASYRSSRTWLLSQLVLIVRTTLVQIINVFDVRTYVRTYTVLKNYLKYKHSQYVHV